MKIPRKVILSLIPTLVAIIFVFWDFQNLGLSFWDEYNYLTTAKWFLGRPGGVFFIYEPPGFPFVIALFFKVFGIKDYSAIMACGIFAVMLVAFMTIIGVKFFNLEVSFFASILAAISPLLLTFSRMAVTDVPFAFFFSAFVVSAYQALRTRKGSHLILAGMLLVGCSSMKYNSFMALLLIIFYIPVFVLSAEKSKRLRALLENFKSILIIFLPTMVLGLGFLFLLGVRGSIRDLMSARTIWLFAGQFLPTFQEGLTKFGEHAIGPHSWQFTVKPLLLTFDYLSTLAYWVPLPFFALAFLGMPRNVKDSPHMFLAFWLIVGFLEISSIPGSVFNMSRAMLPILPPLLFLSAVGLKRAKSVAYFILSKLVHHPNINISSILPFALFLLVVAAGILPAIGTISVYHNAYRQAGEILGTEAGRSATIAQTQLVMRFYYPADVVGRVALNESTLAGYQYLVVDYWATSYNQGPAIQKLREEGHLQLVASIRNEIPPILYTDGAFPINLSQLGTWKYTTIEIYRIINVTSSQTG
jgi:4-amino-4-deoxy-L-arabinose transferase-like glycosyltransferase